MHTHKTPQATFLFNSDLSGDVIIRREDGEDGEAAVPGVALLSFVAQYIRRERISAMEEMSDREILGLP